jgi:hypothetical protein
MMGDGKEQGTGTVLGIGGTVRGKVRYSTYMNIRPTLHRTLLRVEYTTVRVLHLAVDSQVEVLLGRKNKLFRHIWHDHISFLLLYALLCTTTRIAHSSFHLLPICVSLCLL